MCDRLHCILSTVSNALALYYDRLRLAIDYISFNTTFVCCNERYEIKNIGYNKREKPKVISLRFLHFLNCTHSK